jgi:hypothetical protein
LCWRQPQTELLCRRRNEPVNLTETPTAARLRGFFGWLREIPAAVSEMAQIDVGGNNTVTASDKCDPVCNAAARASVAVGTPIAIHVLAAFRKYNHPLRAL